jgi:hypothetical protein
LSSFGRNEESVVDLPKEYAQEELQGRELREGRSDLDVH